MLNHNMKDLGVFVSIFAEAGYLEHAQEYLNEIQERLNAMRGMKRESTAAEVVRRVAEEQLEFEPTTGPLLKYERIGMVAVARQEAGSKTLAEVAQDRNEETAQAVAVINEAHEVAEPEPSIIRDKDGKVTHVSVQAGNPGYDPDIHENTALKIYCDGKHIETAHTADTVAGTVGYYEKNAQGRIKTLTVHGNVVIKGLD